MKLRKIIIISLLVFGSICNGSGSPEHNQTRHSEEQSLEVIRNRYFEYLCGTGIEWTGETDTEYYESMLRSLKRTVDNVREIDLSLGRHVLYQGSRRAEPSVNTELLGNIFNNYLLVLSLGYNVYGPESNPNPFYRSEEVAGMVIELMWYLHDCGFQAGMDIDGDVDNSLKNGKANFGQLSLRFYSYGIATLLMKDTLEEVGMYESCFSTLEYISSSPKSIHRHYEEGTEGYFNSDGIRNVVDRQIPYALALPDNEKAISMFRKIKKSLDVSVSVQPGWMDTIKPDGTGYHHRGNYGSAYTNGFIKEVGLGLYLLSGTAFQPENETYADFEKLLDSFAWFGEALPFGARGRMMQSSGMSSAIHGYLMAALTDGDLYQGADSRFIRLLNKFGLGSGAQRGKALGGIGVPVLCEALKGIEPEDEPTGIRVFPYGAMLVQRQKEWTATIAAYGKYWWDFEGKRTQNAHGQQIGYGALNILRGWGNEADALSGIEFEKGWDWYRIPGVTAPHYPVLKVNPKKDVDARRFGPSPFAGGLEVNGEMAVFAQDFEDRPVDWFEYSPLQAKKSLFFLGDHIVALGSDVICKGTGEVHEIETTLFQSLPMNPLIIDFKPMTEDSYAVQFNDGKAHWLVDPVGTGYYIPNARKLYIQKSVQTSRGLNDNEGEKSGEYVVAGLKHGVAPEGESYHYVVFPNGVHMKRPEVEAISNSYSVLQQDANAHVLVRNNSNILMGAIFGDLYQPVGIIQSMDRPALFILRPEGIDSYDLSLCNPDLGLADPDEKVEFNKMLDDRYMVGRESRVLPVQVTLSGKWELSSETGQAKVIEFMDDKTIVEFACHHGEGIKVTLNKIQ